MKNIMHQKFFFVSLISIYFFINIIVRSTQSQSLELDEAEQVFLSQWLLLGYNAQPPLYNWVQNLFFTAFGTSLATLSGFKNLALLSSYLFYFWASGLVIPNKGLRVIATLSLLAIPQVSFESQRDLTHTVAVIFSTSFFLFALLKTLRTPTASGYAITGLAIGIGLISKYNFAIVSVAAIISILFHCHFRKRLFDWRLGLTVAVAIAVVLPHALWLLHNLDTATSDTLSKMSSADYVHSLLGIGRGLGALLTAIASFSALLVLTHLVVFGQNIRHLISAGNQWSRLIGGLLVAEIGLIVVAVVFGGVDNIRDRWLAPLMLPLPLYLCLKISASAAPVDQAIRRAWIVAFIIMVAVPSALFGRVYFAGAKGRYLYQNVPFTNFAKHLETLPQGKPGLIIAGDTHLAGNLHLSLNDVPTISPVTAPKLLLKSRDESLPTVVVWRNDRRAGTAMLTLPDPLASYLKGTEQTDGKKPIETATFPYVYGANNDTYTFSYMVLPSMHQAVSSR